MKRLPILVLVAALLGAAAPGRALAQTGAAGTTGIGATTLTAADFFLAVQDEAGVNLPPFDLKRFFNKATCDCEAKVNIFASMSQQGFAKRSLVDQTAHISVWIGTSCDNVLLQNSNCLRLVDETLSEFFAHGHETFPTTARILSTYTGSNATSVDGGVVTNTGKFTPTADCTAPISPFTQTIWLLVDTNGDQTNDVTPPATTALRIDLDGPPEPTNVTVTTGNEAVNVNWGKVDVTTTGDLQGYQVFCQRAEGLQVFPTGSFSTPIKRCARAATPPGIEGLDPLFACSPVLSRGTSSYRVKILQNDIFYGAAVVAIDDSGNASSPLSTLHFAKPEKTDSFYDIYREGDNTTAGTATGGYCAVAPADAKHPLWSAGAGATLAFAAVLALRRRRRRP